MAKLRVGDLVKIIGNGHPTFHHHPIGAVGRVVEVFSSFTNVKVGTLEQLINNRDLVLVEDRRVRKDFKSLTDWVLYKLRK